MRPFSKLPFAKSMSIQEEVISGLSKLHSSTNGTEPVFLSLSHSIMNFLTLLAIGFDLQKLSVILIYP